MGENHNKVEVVQHTHNHSMGEPGNRPLVDKGVWLAVVVAAQIAPVATPFAQMPLPFAFLARPGHSLPSVLPAWLRLQLEQGWRLMALLAAGLSLLAQ